MNAAIATKLNVLESAIVRVEEWANVLFVVVKGLGARFVSKKVLKVEEKMETIETVQKTSVSSMSTPRIGRKFEESGKIWEITAYRQNGYEGFGTGYDDSDDDGDNNGFAVWIVSANFVRNV